MAEMTVSLSGIQATIEGDFSTGNFNLSFVYSDLSSGVLNVYHSLGQQYNHITVYDNNNKKINPDFIVATDTNNCAIHLGSFGEFTGTYHLIISK